MTQNQDQYIKHFFDAMSSIDGALLADVNPAKKAPVALRKQRPVWQRYGAVAAALLVLLAGGIFWRLFSKGMMLANKDGATPMDLAMERSTGREALYGGLETIDAMSDLVARARFSSIEQKNDGVFIAEIDQMTVLYQADKDLRLPTRVLLNEAVTTEREYLLFLVYDRDNEQYVLSEQQGAIIRDSEEEAWQQVEDFFFFD